MDNKEFDINYMIGDNLINFQIGTEVYYIESKYSEKYEYCKECKTDHSTGKQTLYYIRPCTICGFEIEGNHSFSYNIKNSFALRIKVIDENDSSKAFNVNEVYFTEEDAQEKIDKMRNLTK